MAYSGEPHIEQATNLLTDEEILKAVERATTVYSFCPHRVWAIANSLPTKEQSLPVLFPPHDISLEQLFRPQRDSPSVDEGHEQCTFDFCEFSQLNFTSLDQRHEWDTCKTSPCTTLDGLFSVDVLNQAVKVYRGTTAWQLRGRDILRNDQSFASQRNKKYMAISHVWSDGTGTGSNPSVGVNECLFGLFRDIACHFDCNGLWWDTICVPTDKAIRVTAINNMHQNYENAHVTLVHDVFLRRLDWIDGETASLAILMSPWFSRGWTALELACSRTVKVLFKDKDEQFTLKDLDKDILANAQSRRHKLAVHAIQSLRHGRVTSVDQLLTILGSRYTSWGRDMAIISALLTGVEIGHNLTEAGDDDTSSHQQYTFQQNIYQKVLKHLGQIHYGHMFHNLPTISGGCSWCPSRLLSLPSSDGHTLEVNHAGDAEGYWIVITLDQIPGDIYDFKDAHPLVAAKLRSALLQTAEHRLLVEPVAKSLTRAILVKRLGESPTTEHVQFIGSLSFGPVVQFKAHHFSTRKVRIINTESSLHQHERGIRSNDVRAMIVSLPDSAEEDVKCADPSPITPPETQVIGSGADQYDTSVIKPKIPVTQEPRSGSFESLETTEEYSDVPTAVVGDSALFRAVRAGSQKAAERIIEQIAIHSRSGSPSADGQSGSRILNSLRDDFKLELNFSGYGGETPLGYAVRRQMLSFVKLLLRYHETNLDFQDVFGQSPLFYAVTRKDNDKGDTIAQLLVEAGADVNLVDRTHKTPLIYSLDKQNEFAVQLLLRAGALVTQESYAMIYRCERRVRALTEANKVDLNILPSRSRLKPLEWAVFSGADDAVKLLLDSAKVDVNVADDRGRTLLMMAIEKRNLGAMTTLLDVCKVDVNIRDTKDESALHYALGQLSRRLKQEDWDVMELLLHSGRADIGSSPLREVLTSGRLLNDSERYGRHDLVKLILKTYDIDQVLANQILIEAVLERSHDVVIILLRHGINPNYKPCQRSIDESTKDGTLNTTTTPLTEAIFNGDLEMVKILLEAGADVNMTSEKYLSTPLILALSDNATKITELLLKQNSIDVYQTDTDGHTPFQIAFLTTKKQGWNERVRLLLGSGKLKITSAEWDNLLELGPDRRFGELRQRHGRIYDQIIFLYSTVLVLAYHASFPSLLSRLPLCRRPPAPRDVGLGEKLARRRWERT